MRKIYIFCALIFTTLPVFAYDYAKDGFKPLQPIENVNKQQYANINDAKQLNLISKLEKRVFGRRFNDNDMEGRVSRLEEQVLGTIFEGDINSRLQTLQRVIPGYLRSKQVQDVYSADLNYCPSAPTYTTTYNPQYYSTPIIRSGGSWRGLAGSLGNFFLGTPTGMSPQIYSPFVSDFAPDYSNGMYTNRGWRLNNMQTGSGVGIKMLP